MDAVKGGGIGVVMALEKNWMERWVSVLQRTSEVGGKSKEEKACN